MKFSGFIKTSLIDYPDTLASVVYLPKCNFNCNFCHNSDIVEHQNPDIEQEEIFKHLQKRKNIIDGLVITGGEPTLHDGLLPFLREVKNYGVKIKLDTNGYRPDVLKTIFQEKLVDYVAMDVKNSQEKYLNTIALDKMDFSNIPESINMIKNSGVDYEFRTTLMKEFHSHRDINDLCELINGAKLYVLQQYQYSEKQIKDEKYTFFAVDEMKEIRDKMKAVHDIGEIAIRGRF